MFTAEGGLARRRARESAGICSLFPAFSPLAEAAVEAQPKYVAHWLLWRRNTVRAACEAVFWSVIRRHTVRVTGSRYDVSQFQMKPPWGNGGGSWVMVVGEEIDCLDANARAERLPN